MLDPITHIRKLTTVLMLSCALNVILLMIFFYWTFKETIPTPYFELKPANKQEEQLPLAIDHSNSDVIRYLRVLPMERLIARLNQTQLIENGYTIRDLTLACLVDVYHFDLTRALAGYPHHEQKRTIIYGKRRNGQNAELSVYAGLSEQQFQSIIKFAITERWPLTSYGLYLALRKQKNINQSLIDAFVMTPEFLAVEMLFSRSLVPVEKSELLQVILQGEWSMLHAFVEQQKMLQDLSSARRQRFLLDYIQQQSKAAAWLLLKTDEALVIRKLDDVHEIEILRLLDEKSPEGEKFAKMLLTSPRSDAVWKAAAERLYAYAEEPMPEKYHHHAALARFVSHSASIVAPVPQAAASAPVPMTAQIQNVSNKKIFEKLIIEKNKDFPVKAKPIAIQHTVASNKHTVHNILPPVMQSQQGTARTVRKERFYVVQEGDSLWKISKKFNVDIEKIRANNKLESDFLKPGRPLIIP